MSKQQILIEGIKFDNMTEVELASRVGEALRTGTGGRILTVNVDILRQLKTTAEEFTRDAIVVADGMPLIWLSVLLRRPLKERVTGASLAWSLSRVVSERNGRVLLLGARPEVAQAAASALRRELPKLSSVDVISPEFGFERDPSSVRKLIEEVPRLKPNLILVALGFPKQERIAAQLQYSLPDAWIVGCGGAVDMIAGEFGRAPQLLQSLGLEWLHRLKLDPRRLFRRYIIQDAPFAAKLLIRTGLRRILGAGEQA